MNRRLALGLIVVGALVLILGGLLLPSAPGRFSYGIEIVDRRPPGESEMPEGLRKLGGMEATVIKPPAGSGHSFELLMMSDLHGLLQAADLAVGDLPRKGSREALAGQATGLKLRAAVPSAPEMKVVGRLGGLGPAFDSRLLSGHSADLRRALEKDGWTAETRYLLLPDSFERREEVVAKLRAEADLLPDPGAEIRSPSGKPAVSRRAQLGLGLGLLLLGLGVSLLQLRGLKRADVAAHLGRGRRG